MSVLAGIIVVARYAVAVLVALACVVALVMWAVRRGKLSAFGSIARTTRSLADPVLKPFERRVIGWGGNPQDAPLWLIGAVLVTGLIFLAVLKWIIRSIYYVSTLAGAGPRGWILFIIDTAYFILAGALLIRVIGSWFGMGRYNRWIRVTYTLTDWLVEPIRRRLPPFGMIDISPLLAWLVLLVARAILTSILL